MVMIHKSKLVLPCPSAHFTNSLWRCQFNRSKALGWNKIMWNDINYLINMYFTTYTNSNFKWNKENCLQKTDVENSFKFNELIINDLTGVIIILSYRRNKRETNDEVIVSLKLNRRIIKHKKWTPRLVSENLCNRRFFFQICEVEVKWATWIMNSWGF